MLPVPAIPYIKYNLIRLDSGQAEEAIPGRSRPATGEAR